MFNVEEWNKLTQGEKSLYNWQFRQHGSFFNHVWLAISVADEYHLERMRLAFPSEVEAYINYARVRGWWDELLERVGRPG